MQKLAAQVWKRLPGTKSARSSTEQDWKTRIAEFVNKIPMMELARGIIFSHV